MVCINGSLGTNLYEDGEVIVLCQEFYPDEEFVEEEWPEVMDDSL